MRLYHNASVLVSLLAADAFTARAYSLVASSSPVLLVSDFAAAEFASALARRVRSAELAADKAREAFADFDGWTARAARRVETAAADVRGGGVRAPSRSHLARPGRAEHRHRSTDGRGAGDLRRQGGRRGAVAIGRGRRGVTGANPGGGASSFDLGDVSPAEFEALRRMVAYCERHWDDESQTVLGVSRDEVRAVLAGWPENLARADRVAALAVNNAVAYSVHGRPPPGPDGVLEMAGVSRDESRDLFERLRPRLHAIIDRA